MSEDSREEMWKQKPGSDRKMYKRGLSQGKGKNIQHSDIDSHYLGDIQTFSGAGRNLLSFFSFISQVP